MKKEFKYYKICQSAAKILIIAFIISVIRDYFTYNTTLNSAPFYVFILGDAILTAVPAVIMYLLSKWLKNKDI